MFLEYATISQHLKKKKKMLRKSNSIKKGKR